jgi:hypothetical protein
MRSNRFREKIRERDRWRVIVGSIKYKPGLRVESILGQIDFWSGTNTPGRREYYSRFSLTPTPHLSPHFFISLVRKMHGRVPCISDGRPPPASSSPRRSGSRSPPLPSPRAGPRHPCNHSRADSRARVSVLFPCPAPHRSCCSKTRPHHDLTEQALATRSSTMQVVTRSSSVHLPCEEVENGRSLC